MVQLPKELNFAFSNNFVCLPMVSNVPLILDLSLSLNVADNLVDRDTTHPSNRSESYWLQSNVFLRHPSQNNVVVTFTVSVIATVVIAIRLPFPCLRWFCAVQKFRLERTFATFVYNCNHSRVQCTDRSVRHRQQIRSSRMFVCKNEAKNLSNTKSKKLVSFSGRGDTQSGTIKSPDYRIIFQKA